MKLIYLIIGMACPLLISELELCEASSDNTYGKNVSPQKKLSSLGSNDIILWVSGK